MKYLPATLFGETRYAPLRTFKNAREDLIANDDFDITVYFSTPEDWYKLCDFPKDMTVRVITSREWVASPKWRETKIYRLPKKTTGYFS